MASSPHEKHMTNITSSLGLGTVSIYYVTMQNCCPVELFALPRDTNSLLVPCAIYKLWIWYLRYRLDWMCSKNVTDLYFFFFWGADQGFLGSVTIPLVNGICFHPGWPFNIHRYKEKSEKLVSCLIYGALEQKNQSYRSQRITAHQNSLDPQLFKMGPTLKVAELLRTCWQSNSILLSPFFRMQETQINNVLNACFILYVES